MNNLPSGTITFLFTDVHDSSRLWEKHPTEMDQALKRHDEIIESIAQEHQGFMVRPRGEGDSRFVVFERGIDGVSAAAAIQQALHTEKWSGDINLLVRMAVHTGEGEFRDGDYYGSAVNRSANLRNIAHAGQILLSQTTFDLVQDILPEGIELLALGLHPLKGIMRPEHIYQLMAPGLPISFPPLFLDQKQGDVPAKPPPFLDLDLDEKEAVLKRPVFVAREKEISLLENLVEKVISGDGQVALITGGAGRGKTALLDEFCFRSQQKYDDLIFTRGNCNSHTGIGDPYLPFRDITGMLTGDVETSLVAGSITPDHAQRLWGLLLNTVDALLKRGPSLIDVLVHGDALLDRTETASPEDVNRLRQLKDLVERKKTSLSDLDQGLIFEQFTSVLLILAEHHPLILVLDDMQWADRTSIDMLFHLGRRIKGHPILLLVAYRPDEVSLGRDDKRHPLENVVNELRRQYGEIIIDLTLDDEGEDQDFVEHYLDTEPNHLGSKFRQTLRTHTGGHPLFTVELLRAMMERGDLIKDDQDFWIEGPELDWNKLPARVEAVIEERTERLEDDLKDLLSVASVEGKSFTAQILARIQKIEERKILSDLSKELSRRHRLVHELGEIVVGQQILSKFQFAHHLFQSYLYNEMSTAELRLLHGEITTILEDIFSGDEERYAVQLAYHSQRANLTEKTIRYLRLAGDQSKKNYANEEAIKHYSELLDMLPPESPERFEVLGLRASVFAMLANRHAQLADAEEMFVISNIHRDESMQFEALLALADAHLEGEHILAEKPSMEALDLAKKLNDPACEARALQRLGWGAWQKFEHVVSLKYLKEAADYFQQANKLDNAARCLHILSLAHGRLYDIDAAIEAVQKAIELCRRIGDRRNEAISLRRLAITHNQLEQFDEALPIAEKALAIHREIGDLNEEALALNMLGVTYCRLGRGNESKAAFRKSLQICHDLHLTTGILFASRSLIYYHYWSKGRYEESLQLLEEEFDWAKSVEDDWLAGMLNSTKGWCLTEFGQLNAAINPLEFALSTFSKYEPEGQQYTNTLARIGFLHALLGNKVIAEEYSVRAQEITFRVLRSVDQLLVVPVIGRTILLLGSKEHFQKVYQAINESLEIVLRLPGENTILIEELLTTSAKMLLEMGDFEGAYECSSKLVSFLDKTLAPFAFHTSTFTHAQVLQALGRNEEAKHYITRAYDWVMLVAENTENEIKRQAWLDDPQSNREIIADYEALSL
jgi:class 3 adenylate cyclase/tetratricopeptide (TPR) repeat protein